jgi:ATP-dependent Clp protease adaptor protein ClpS
MGTDVELKKEERVKTELKPPAFYKVIFHNDDYTSMELVVFLLTKIFKHSESAAKEIMLEIHNTGTGVAGVYTYEIAEQKGETAKNIARENGAPLKITIEEEE